MPEPCLEAVAENSPNSLSELGLRDHSDPGPEGSHQGDGGQRPTDPSSSVPSERGHRANTSFRGPSRSGYNVGIAPPMRSPSSSPSVSSRRRYTEPDTPPRGLRRERTRSPSRRPNPGRVSPRRTRPARGNAGEDIIRELRDIVGNMRSTRRARERQDPPPSPPDFLKMVMTMQHLGTQKFFGNKGPLASDSWLKHVERNFCAARCPEEFRVDVATHYLMHDACNWWEGVKLHFAGTRCSWDEFKREFERKYFPPEARDRMEAQFQNLVQGERSVRDYENEFTRLRPYAHYGAGDEPVVIRKFLRGLRPRIMSRLVVNQYYSLFELVERAVDVEAGIKVEQDAEDRIEQRNREQPPTGPVNQVPRPSSWTPGRGRGQFQGQTFGRGGGQGRGQGSGRGEGQGRGQVQGRGQGRGAAGRGTPTMSQLPVCYRCGGRGHFAKSCPDGRPATRPVPEGVICFTCNQPGHYATSCPVIRPTGQSNPGAGVRAMDWEVEPSAKRPAIEGRVYSLDKPGPSKPDKGPITGT